MTPNEPTALVLMTYGTPDGPESVEPYLFNIFNDPDILVFPWYSAFVRPFLARKIAKSRREEVIHNYARIGGRSPLVELTAAQGEALVASLGGNGAFKLVLGMRYWHPFAREAIRTIVDQGIRRVLLVPMYPQYSRATTGSAISDFRRAVEKLGLIDQLEVRAICCFPDSPGMIAAMAADIEKAMGDLSAAERAATPLLFSAHGVPKSFIDGGDPYQGHVERTARAVVEKLGGHPDVTVCYQSRVGRQVWLEPYTDEVLTALVKRKVSRIVLYPVAFITEHSETLFELDLLYGDPLRAAGIDYRRVPALGTNRLFIDALADEVRKAMAGPTLPWSKVLTA